MQNGLKPRLRRRMSKIHERNSVTERFKIYSSQLSFSNSCALGRSFGSKVKHLRKNAAAPDISFSSMASSMLRKMSSRVVGAKSLFV
jgi:hypothetical protein